MLITEFIEGIGRTSFTTPAARRVEKIMTGRTEGYVDMTTDLTFFSKRDETGAMPKYCVCAYLRRGKKFPDEELFPYGTNSLSEQIPSFHRPLQECIHMQTDLCSASTKTQITCSIVCCSCKLLLLGRSGITHSTGKSKHKIQVFFFNYVPRINNSHREKRSCIFAYACENAAESEKRRTMNNDGKLKPKRCKYTP